MRELYVRAGVQIILLLVAASVSYSQAISGVPGGVITIVAGTGKMGTAGDRGPAINAQLDYPVGIAIDAVGAIYIAEPLAHWVRKVTPDGKIVTVAGNGTFGLSGDGGPATSASLASPQGLAIDAAGNLYIADGSIRKVTPSGLISTVAGGGMDHPGDGGPATSAWLNGAVGVAVDAAGNLYIADSADHRVRKVTPAGIISTVAGNGTFGSVGDGGPATAAQLAPRRVAVDSAGNLYITCEYDRVRKVTPAGVINTFAGNSSGDSSILGDGGPATAAHVNNPKGVLVDKSGSVYVATGPGNVRKVTADGIIDSVVGKYQYQHYDGSWGCCGLLATSATVDAEDIAFDATGNLYIAGGWENLIYKVVAETYTGTAKPKVTSVVNAADYHQGVAPSTWITIQGTNLSPTTRSWSAADFIQGSLPGQLDGVRAYVEGWATIVSYISPTQINALVVRGWDADPDFLRGSVPVEVLTPQGRSDPVLVERTGCFPGLFRLPAEDGKWVVANTPDGTMIGRLGLVPGLTTRPARPGEILATYGTGFGPTNPPVPAGGLVAAPAALANKAYLDTDYAYIYPIWAGIISPGLYQLNFVVPNVPDGDYRFTPNGCAFTKGSDGWITIKSQ